MAYNATGTAGNDTLNQGDGCRPRHYRRSRGRRLHFQGTGLATVTGDSGNDIVVTQAGNTGTVDGGTENDSIFAAGNSGSMLLSGMPAPIRSTSSLQPARQTIVGGTDSSDGADCILGSNGPDLIFGNGGNDILDVSDDGRRAETIPSSAASAMIRSSAAPTGGTDLVFGNEGNDTIYLSGGNDTDFGGLGNDCLY